MNDDQGFLSRWSRRKAQVQSGQAVPAEPPRAPSPSPAVIAPVEADTPAPVADAPKAELPPLPTLDDVAKLTRDSDYAPFVRAGVDPGVRNAAMKKLFSDPHFNVMDGLDVYIDDYNTPDPLPASMLRKMVQAHTLGLFDDDEDDEHEPAQAVAAEAAKPPADEDADLQLQPHDAARREGAGGGADAEPGERRDDSVA
jgi:hypothetical protein